MYKNRFSTALKRTYELGLSIEKDPLPFKITFSNKKQINILKLCYEALIHYGYNTSSDLAQKCIPVNLMLKEVIKENLGVDSFITIGDRYWDDYIYCEMSYEGIKKELEKPDIHNPIKAHVWLTLPDGFILDCTAEAHLDLLSNRGEHPTDKCILFINPNKKENEKEGFHRPLLIGTDFLVKTGSIRLESKNL